MDQMMEWVELLQGKLREMNILSPKDNLYSKLPESRINNGVNSTNPLSCGGLVSTRDPNSPLPPPPNGFVLSDSSHPTQPGPASVSALPVARGTQEEPSVYSEATAALPLAERQVGDGGCRRGCIFSSNFNAIQAAPAISRSDRSPASSSSSSASNDSAGTTASFYVKASSSRDTSGSDSGNGSGGSLLPGIYTERVLERVIEAVKVLRDQVMPNFAQRVEIAVEALLSNPSKEVDENEFIDASRLADDELDPEDVEFDEHYTETRSKSSAHTGEHIVDEYPDISGITTAREAMRKMTEEDKERIAQQVESFRTEKLKFDREVAKWDDTGNDLIVITKHMCMIMMEMTDFTRGRGPLKTTMDVINAAKKISEAGTMFDKLARQIADQCRPESSTKKDLIAYLQNIPLYCHQLRITSKVKADVQNISGELIVSGLDFATSLIQAAKNLMNALVLTVKASYVASTKYPRQGAVSLPIVVWKMKAPEKKPLVRREKPEEVRAKVRRASQKKQQNPIQALSEFQSPADAV